MERGEQSAPVVLSDSIGPFLEALHEAMNKCLITGLATVAVWQPVLYYLHEMENCPSPTFDQKTFEVTTTLQGADGEDRTERRKRNRRSLGRRVSFAEAPAYHIFARDDDYVSPSHDKKDAGQVVVGTAPCSESKKQATPNLNEGRTSHSTQKSFSPSVGSSSWHPAINTTTLSGDDGEFSSFVASPDTPSRQKKEHAIDEDVTLDSTAFLSLNKGKSLQVEDMLIESPLSVSGNKELVGRRDSSDGEDMSMWIPNVIPIIRANTLDVQPGSNGSFSDMSLTMQVHRKRIPSPGVDCKHSVLEERSENAAKDMFSLQEIVLKERDQNITKDIPSLQELVHEVDDDDMVTEMQMETEVLSKRPEGFDPERSVTNGGVGFPGPESKLCGDDGVALVEEESHQVTFFEGQSSDLLREELEADRSITLAIPRLGSIIREDVDDSVLLKQQETASKNAMLPSSQYGTRSIPIFDGEVTGSITAQVPKISDVLAADTSGSITVQVPRISDLLAADSTGNITAQVPALRDLLAGDTTGNITAQVPGIIDLLGGASASPYIASEWSRRRRRSSLLALAQTSPAAKSSQGTHSLGKVSVTPSSDSSMEIVDERSERIAFVRIPPATGENTNLMNLPSQETARAIDNGDSQTVDIGGLRSNSVGLPPSSLARSDVVSMEANISTSPFEADMEVVDSGDTISALGEFKFPLMTPSSSEAICAFENIDSKVVGLSRPSSSEEPENVVPASSSDSTMEMVGSAPEYSRNATLAGTSHQDQVEIPTHRSEQMEMDVEASPIPRAHGAQELISSVLRNAARLTPRPTMTLDRSNVNKQDRKGSKKSRIEGSESGPQQPEASSYQTEPQRSVFIEHITDGGNKASTPEREDTAHQAKKLAVSLPPDSRKRIQSSSTQQYQHLSASTPGQRKESEQGKQEDKLTRKEKAKAESRTEGEVTRCEGVEQTPFLPDKSPLRPVRSIEGRNISVGEFLKLAQVVFSPKARDSGLLKTDMSSSRAYDVRGKTNAFRYLLVVRPEDEVFEQACYKLEELLDSVQISVAKLQEEISASNPPLFFQFQSADAEEKQQLYEQINHLRQKCSREIGKHLLNIHFGLEEDKRRRLLVSKEDIKTQDQEVCDVNKDLGESIVKEEIPFLKNEIRSRTKKRERVAGAQEIPANKDCHKHREQLYLHKINHLKERLAEINVSKKVMHGKLLQRVEMVEEKCNTFKEDLKAQRLRVDQLQIQLVADVHKSRSQAASLQIAANPRLHLKEMMKKLTLLKKSEVRLREGNTWWSLMMPNLGGLNLKEVQHDILELSFSPIIKKRLTLAESASGTVVTQSTWDLDAEMIDLVFPGINAPEAFLRTLTDGADYLTRSPQRLRSYIQKTWSLVQNLLAFMGEVCRCGDRRNAVAGKSVLLEPQFYSENDKDLHLEIKFMDCLLSAKIVLTLDVRIAMLNGYPYGDVPIKISQFHCARRFSHTLSTEALEAAIAAVKLGYRRVEPGYEKVQRLCAAVGSFLASARSN
ncbi:hypothetical protein R1sor_016653 [Riccia sorocarpa]|uniref:Spc7 kinetochore protein domain-containing protein n=1 Tax=Riccia sorocarpa TaxID=122646 RepID=A0ABD3HIY3_9MARC